MPVNNGATAVFVGDSITEQDWMGVSGGLVDQINAQLDTPITAINSGVTGNTTADVAAAVAARITDYNPDVIVMLLGVNDVNLSVATDTIETNYRSILSQIRAWSSTVPIVCMSILFIGEQWADWPGGPLWDNAKDTAVTAANQIIQAACETYGARYADPRAQALIYESVNNTPAPGAATGVLCKDAVTGIHPNATGQLQIGNWMIGNFAVTP